MVRKLIGLCGHAGAGKSTLAESLYRHHHYTRTSFATPIKRMLAQLMVYQHAPVGSLNDPTVKSMPSPWLNNRTPRYALQTLGTEWGRDGMGDDFWVTIWGARIENFTKVVVDDMRFCNESDKIHELGGVVVKVERDGAEGTGMDHVSERELQYITPDLTIVNDSDPEAMLKELEFFLGDKI